MLMTTVHPKEGYGRVVAFVADKRKILSYIVVICICTCMLFEGYGRFYGKDVYIQQVSESVGQEHKVWAVLPSVSVEQDLFTIVQMDVLEQLQQVRNPLVKPHIYPVEGDTHFAQLSDLCSRMNVIIQQLSQEGKTDEEISVMVLDAVDEISSKAYVPEYDGRVVITLMELLAYAVFTAMFCVIQWLRVCRHVSKHKNGDISV